MMRNLIMKTNMKNYVVYLLLVYVGQIGLAEASGFRDDEVHKERFLRGSATREDRIPIDSIIKESEQLKSKVRELVREVSALNMDKLSREERFVEQRTREKEQSERVAHLTQENLKLQRDLGKLGEWTGSFVEDSRLSELPELPVVTVSFVEIKTTGWTLLGTKKTVMDEKRLHLAASRQSDYAIKDLMISNQEFYTQLKHISQKLGRAIETKRLDDLQHASDVESMTSKIKDLEKRYSLLVKEKELSEDLSRKKIEEKDRELTNTISQFTLRQDEDGESIRALGANLQEWKSKTSLLTLEKEGLIRQLDRTQTTLDQLDKSRAKMMVSGESLVRNIQDESFEYKAMVVRLQEELRQVQCRFRETEVRCEELVEQLRRTKNSEGKAEVYLRSYKTVAKSVLSKSGVTPSSLFERIQSIYEELIKEETE